jgi:hypothetical protein
MAGKMVTEVLDVDLFSRPVGEEEFQGYAAMLVDDGRLAAGRG